MKVDWKKNPEATVHAAWTLTVPVSSLCTSQGWYVFCYAQVREGFQSSSANWFHMLMFPFSPYSSAPRASSHCVKMRPDGFPEKAAWALRAARLKLLLSGGWPEHTGVRQRGSWWTVRGRDATRECLQTGVRVWALQEGLKNVGSGPGPASFNVLSNSLSGLYQCLGTVKVLD